MYLLSTLTLTLACLAAVVYGSTEPYDFEAALQEANECAREVSPYIDDVSAALAPFLAAAEALNEATAALDQLDDTITCLDELKGEVRQADRDDAGTRGTTARTIQEMRRAAGTLLRQFSHLFARSSDTVEYSQELQESIREQQQVLQAGNGPIRCRSDQVGDNYYDTAVGCYYLETTHMTWEDGRQACIARGMDLASIISQEQQDVLDALYETRRSDFHYHWTSGRLTSTPENNRLWVWRALNDQPIDYADWNSGQPNYLSGDDTIIGSCRTVDGQQRTWCDYGSHNTEPSLCQQY